MSQQDFANKLGISPASLSSIYTGRTNPTNNHVQAVHRAFPDVNINWLLFGEGEMFGGAVSGGAPVEGLGQAVGDVPATRTGPVSDMSGTLFGQAVTGGDLSGGPSGRAGEPGLFASVGNGAGRTDARSVQKTSVPRRDTACPRRDELPTGGYVKEKPLIVRKVKEIRVFFDDGTYESFVPSGK